MGPEKSLRSRKVDNDAELLIERKEVSGDSESAFTRARPALKTGMDKGEEDEIHIKRAMEQQAAEGSTGIAIPIPQISELPPEEARLESDFVVPPVYLRTMILPWDDPECRVLYDMDEDDNTWLAGHNAKNRRVTEDDFEVLIDRLEKATNTKDTLAAVSDVTLPPTLSERTAGAIREYWMAKRKAWGKPLLRVFWPPPDHDNPDPHLAFRPLSRSYARRRKANDDVAYNKLVRLKGELEDVMTILQNVIWREEIKRDLLLSKEAVFHQLSKEDKGGLHRHRLLYHLPKIKKRPRPASPQDEPQNEPSGPAGPDSDGPPLPPGSAGQGGARHGHPHRPLGPGGRHPGTGPGSSSYQGAYLSLFEAAGFKDLVPESEAQSLDDDAASLSVENIPLPVVNRAGIRSLYMDPSSSVMLSSSHAAQGTGIPITVHDRGTPHAHDPTRRRPHTRRAGYRNIGSRRHVLQGTVHNVGLSSSGYYPARKRQKPLKVIRRIGRGGRVLYDRVLDHHDIDQDDDHVHSDGGNSGNDDGSDEYEDSDLFSIHNTIPHTTTTTSSATTSSSTTSSTTSNRRRRKRKRRKRHRSRHHSSPPSPTSPPSSSSTTSSTTSSTSSTSSSTTTTTSTTTSTPVVPLGGTIRIPKPGSNEVQPTLFARPVTKTTLYLDTPLGPPSRVVEYVRAAEVVRQLARKEYGTPLADLLGYVEYDPSFDLNRALSQLKLNQGIDQDGAVTSSNLHQLGIEMARESVRP